MTDCRQASEKEKENELKALFFMEYSHISDAEKVLLDNMNKGTCSALTYDLLIKIYEKKQDFHSLVKILNHAIKNTPRSDSYRKLKKQVIISRIFSDMSKL